MNKKIIAFFKGAGVENILARGSVFTFVIQGAGAALLLLTEIFAARLLGVGQFGIYSAASRVAYVVVFGLVSANAVVAPMIARLHSTGRHENLQKMVRLAAKGILLFTAPVALILD